MNSAPHGKRPPIYEYGDDYEVVAVTDKGAIFRTPENKLVWLETAKAPDFLLDDIRLPQED